MLAHACARAARGARAGGGGSLLAKFTAVVLDRVHKSRQVSACQSRAGTPGHRHPVPIKIVFRGKVVAKRGLCGAGLSLGAWGQLRFLALCPPPCAIVTGAAALDQVGRAARRSTRVGPWHAVGAMPCAACRPSDAMRQLAVPRYWEAGSHFKSTVVRNKQDTNRHYLTIATNTSIDSVTIIK
eukprot:SAG31_NODE_73_length_27793_cov_26.900520_1_plen_183_part_00